MKRAIGSDIEALCENEQQLVCVNIAAYPLIVSDSRQLNQLKTMEEDRIAPIFKGRHILLTGGESHKKLLKLH